MNENDDVSVLYEKKNEPENEIVVIYQVDSKIYKNNHNIFYMSIDSYIIIIKLLLLKYV